MQVAMLATIIAPVMASRRLDYTDVARTHNELFKTLGAFRFLCRCPGVEQYDEDMQTLASEPTEVGTIVDWLIASGFSQVEQDEWFAAAEARDLITTADGFFAPKDACSWCDHAEEYYLEGAFNEVRVHREYRSWRTETWHEDALGYAFFCDISQEWYAGSEFTESTTAGGSTICEEWAVQNDWFYSEQQDGWTDEPDDDSSDDRDEYGIPSYHSAERNWSYMLANRSTRAFYGFEIELLFSTTRKCVAFYGDYLADEPDVCGERDGSLDDDRGLEIITRPFSLEELREPGNRLETLLANAAAYGADPTEGDECYGIHITTNWGRLTSDHQDRMRAMVYEQRQMTIWVSQRETSYAEFNPDKGSHHTALHIRSRDAAEMRTFQSTLDWPQVMSYVEYLDALAEWTRNPARPINGPLVGPAFRAWVRSHPSYPHLAARMRNLKKTVEVTNVHRHPEAA
jgi:hypothetical protein